MKTILVTLLSLVVIAGGYCAESGIEAGTSLSRITCNFKIPSDWKKGKDDLYTLKNFNKSAKRWDNDLSGGHQPWRLEPANAAAACLWNFGIADGSKDVFQFAERLTTITEGKLYMLKAGKSNYYVFVRTYEAIPVAYKLMVLGD